MKKTIVTASIIVGFLAGASALSALADTTNWTAPTVPPPGGNIAAPINVGDVTQAKTGLLGLKALQFEPDGATNIVVGSVLTAQDQYGTVAWNSVPSVPTALVVLDSTPAGGTWTVPAGVTRIRVRVWGAGGAGGDGTGSGGPGSGGGAGGYGESVMSVTPGQVISVSVGVGGQPAIPNTGNDGQNGGNTVFGPITANGGTGGQTDHHADASPFIPAGGAVTGAQISIRGGSGGIGGNNTFGPNGGSSPMGGSGGISGIGDSGLGISGGQGGLTPGGGGGGASGSPTYGGSGGNGRVVIEY